MSTAAAYSHARTRKVAFLISDGTVVLDYTGAYEVFGQAKMKVFTVAKTTGPVKLSSNLQVIPNYSIENSPEPDILVIPVGGPENDPAIVDWIKAKASKTEYILTICGGVYPVYAAGLLDGLTATTYGPLIDHFKEHARKTRVVTDKRFVDNGKIVTAGSYVAGIDAALYIISKLDGEPRAQEVANNIEYNWDKSYRYVRAKLADNWLAPLYDFGPPLNGKTLKYEGNEEHWVAEYEVTRKGSLKEFSSQIPEMAQMHHWRNSKTSETVSSYHSEWTRKDLDNRDWVCSVTINKLDGPDNRFFAQLRDKAKVSACSFSVGIPLR
jgi:putative intracellular protease/amidase